MAPLLISTPDLRLTFWILTFLITSSSVELPYVVLTWTITVDDRPSRFAFQREEMAEFYSCLCNSTIQSCTVHKNASTNWVTSVCSTGFGNFDLITATYSSRYWCGISGDHSLHCEKMRSSDEGCSQTDTCSTFRINDNNVEDTCDLKFAEITWTSGQSVNEQIHDSNFVNRTSCEAVCNVITLVTSTSETLNSNEDTKDGDDTSGVIIGAVVGAVVFVATLVVVGVVLLRSKRNATNGANSDTGHTDCDTSDTPYPLTFNNTSNAQPIMNSPSMPQVQGEISADIYPIVDPAKKTRPNDGVKASIVEDHEYYNQNDVVAVNHPKPGNSYNDSKLTGQQDRDYYNLDKEPVV